jgi:hypothetical protein
MVSLQEISRRNTQCFEERQSYYFRNYNLSLPSFSKEGIKGR